MFLARLLVFLVCLVVGCSPAALDVPVADVAAHPADGLALRPLYYGVVIHGDTRFEANERTLAEYAADSWRQLTAGRVDVVLKWDLDEVNLIRLRDSARMIRVSSEDPRTTTVRARHRLPPNVHVAAWTHLPDKDLPLLIGIVPDAVVELTPVFLHEFGHAAGIDDIVTRERGVMNVVYGAWRFSVADWSACTAAMLCSGAPPPGLLR